MATTAATTADSSDGSAQAPGTPVRYYVHFERYPKRCDQWVTPERVRPWTAEKDGDFGADNEENEKDVGAGFVPNEMIEKRPGTRVNDVGTADRKLTRTQKRRLNEMNHVERAPEDMAPLERLIEEEHEQKTRVKNVETIEMGRYEIDCWYYSPYPDDFVQNGKLFVCERCLKYMKRKKTLVRHRERGCALAHPPGDEIYRHPPSVDPNTGAETRPRLSMYEVDGRRAGVYCQNLCLLSKLFSGPQDALLRCGAVSVLRSLRGGRQGASRGWVLQQGEVHARELQPGVYINPAAVPAQGVR